MIRTSILTTLITTVFAFSLMSTGYAASTVAPLAPTDEAITDYIHEQIDVDSILNKDEFSVTVSEGIVTLQGTVDTLYAEERAILLAESTHGARSVINRITVTPVERADQQILTDVRSALATHPVIESWDIQTRVNDGVVILTGKTNSRVEKDFAAKVSKTVRGVKGIDNQIRVVTHKERPDADIATDIKYRLANSTRVDPRHLSITVNDGVVTLDGPVISLSDKRHVEELAWVDGVERVHSDGVTVDLSVFNDTDMSKDEYHSLVARTNDEIRDAINDALHYDPRVNEDSVMIHVQNGVVTLSGIMPSLFIRNAAIETATNTAGVLSVDNNIVIRSNPYLDDDTLLSVVTDALERDSIASPYTVDVTVDDQVVTLSGTVDSHPVMTQMVYVVEQVHGVENVINTVTVISEGPVSVTTLQSSIEEELEDNPFIQEDRVNVTVAFDMVTLRGTVDSIQEKEYVEQTARDNGAKYVYNYLWVNKPKR